MNLVAWRMLTHERAKYLGLIFAIAFSTFLLENQTSIFAGILKRTASQILDVTDADVWVMDPAAWAVRLFKGMPVARTEAGRFAQSIVLGLDDATLTGAPRRMVMGSWEGLREPDSVVMDRAGYLLLFPGEPLFLGRRLELNDHAVTLVGISEAGAPFASFPVIHARYSVAVNFQGMERSQLSYVIGRPAPGITPEELCAAIQERTGLRARTSKEFAFDCVRYYLKNTGIPVNFGITIGIALVVGTVVAGQTFYLFTIENLRQFGTLKAIGVPNPRLIGMVLLQAFSVGLIGFALGTGMAAAFFDIFQAKTATRGIILMWQSVALTGGCMAFVVVVASLLSLRRVLILEPATVFRS